jgi:hypothetical protein
MKIRLLGAFVCLFALGIAVGGCGSATKLATTKTKHISAEEVNLGLDRQAIALGVIKCIRDEQNNGDSGKALGEISKTEGREVDHAVGELITTFRKNPNIILPSEKNPNRSMRTYLAEEAESLQSCWPWLTREIRTVLTYG